MDGLSTAASLIAVISLALQLTDYVKNLHRFWSSIRSIRGAPPALQSIVDDLELLSTIASEIASQRSHCNSSPTMNNVLQDCLRQIEGLQAITDEFERGFTSSSRRKRLWSAVKVLFNKEKIDEFRLVLVNFKSTLLVAHQVAFNQSIYGLFDKQQQAIPSMSQKLENMELERSSQTVTIQSDSGTASLVAALQREVDRMASKEGNPFVRSGFEMAMTEVIKQLFSLSPEMKIHNTTPTGVIHSSSHLRSQISGLGISVKKRRRDRSLTYQSDTERNNVFGKVHLSFRTYQILSDEGEPNPDNDFQEETEISFRFHPASWIVNLGLSSGLTAYAVQSGQIWKHVMETFRPVRDNSDIFEFCTMGNIDAVKYLLSNNRASPWDTNSTGWTPLHIAAQSINPELCNLLLDAGADVSARPYKYGYSCLSLATEKYSKNSVKKTIDTLRIFLDEADDFHDGFGDGWTTLFSLAEIEGVHPFNEHQSALAWFIRIMQHDIQLDTNLTNDSDSSMASLLEGIIANSNLELFKFILSAFSNFVDVKSGDHGITPLIECLHQREYTMARALIQRGANLHAEGYDMNAEIFVCPTSCALYSSASFFEWRKLLKTESVDLEDYIASALKLTSVSRDGWRKDTLQKLFDLDFEPTPSPILHRCANSNLFEDCVKTFVELSWQRLLDCIILGEDATGVFEGYPKPKGSGEAVQQKGIQKIFDSNHEEDGFLYRCQDDIPTLKTNLMHTNAQPEDSVDDEATSWLCMTCWRRMIVYEDGSGTDTSSRHEYLTDNEGSDEEGSDEEGSDEESEEDSPFLFSI